MGCLRFQFRAPILDNSKTELAYHVVLACDPFEYGRALFHEFSKCPTVLPLAGALLDHIRVSGKQAPLDGYLIHSHRYQTNEPAITFWNIQAAIVTQLRLIWQLNLFVAFVHPDHDGCSVSKFVNQLLSSGWVLSRTTCSFPNFGESVIEQANLIVGVHDSTQSRTEPISFQIPSSPTPLPLAAYIWEPFNKPEYSISFAKDDDSFATDANHGITATVPTSSVLASLLDGVQPLYYLHLGDLNMAMLAGMAVMSLDSLCPAFDGLPNTNLFCSWFGIE